MNTTKADPSEPVAGPVERPVRPHGGDIAEAFSKALRRAYSLGQTYWQQADSESYAQNRRADETSRKFEDLVRETREALFAHCKDVEQGTRHACSIAVWMTLQDALAEGADDKGLDGWMREAEQRVKNRLAHHGHSSEKRERQPLSQDAILDFAEGCTLQFHDLLEFARKVERAHGIEA